MRAYRAIQRKKIKNSRFNTDFYLKSGSINATFVVVALLVVASAVYLYTINTSAVKGYEIRNLEKEIAELKKENKQLRIKKAELNSLYKIEKERDNLEMSETQPEEIVYIEENSPVALK